VPEALLTRLGDWWRRSLDRGDAPREGGGWDPILPAGDQPPEDSLARARLAERVMLLATLCRASYGGFTGAAHHTRDRALSDWLRGCARQRKALASELRGIVLVLAEGEAVAPPWQRWVAQVAIENTGGWGEGWINRCIRGEENLLRLYDQLFAARLPSGISAMLRRQYGQIVGTLEALRHQSAGTV
jgi:hypothetical protein